MTIANVALTNTFDEWRMITNQTVTVLNEIEANANLFRFQSNTSSLQISPGAGRGTIVFIGANVTSNISDTSNINFAAANTVNTLNDLVITVDQRTNAVYNIINAGYTTANAAYNNANSISVAANNYAGAMANSANVFAARVGVNANGYAVTVGSSGNNYAGFMVNTEISTINSHIQLTYATITYSQGIATNTTAAFAKANAAYDIAISLEGANVVADVIGAYGTANGAFLNSNSAYDFANGVSTNTTAAFTRANGAVTNAAAAFGFANGVSTNTTAAFAKANSVETFATGVSTNTTAAFARANGAVTNAAAAFGFANGVSTNTIAAFGFANGVSTNTTAAFAKANSVETFATGVSTNTTAAFARANLANSIAGAAVKRAGDRMTGLLEATNGLTILAAGLGEGGELVLEKGTTSVLSGNVVIDLFDDSIRIFEQSGTSRGLKFNVAQTGTLVSSEIIHTTNILQYAAAKGAYDVANASFGFANGISTNTTAAFGIANSAVTNAAAAFSFANGVSTNTTAAFAKANAALANTSGVVFAGNLTITNNLVSDNITTTNASTFASGTKIRKQDTSLEGGELVLEKPTTSGLAGDIVVDINQNSFRVFENGGTTRGFSANLLQMQSQSVMLHSDNYNSYAPSLTGTGASGTWSIGISGSAAQLNGQSASYYTNIPARLGYTPANKAGDTFTGSVTVNGTVTGTSFVGVFPSGTKMMFVQTAAPTGWTKDTTHNNKALRVVSGTASSGGTVAFTTAFTSQAVSGSVSTSGTVTPEGSVSTTGTVGSTTLTTSQIPSHDHSYLGGQVTNSGVTAGNAIYAAGALQTGTNGGGASHNHSWSGSSTFTGTSSSISATSTFTGTSSSISATSSFTGTAINLAVQYVDVIIATKD